MDTAYQLIQALISTFQQFLDLQNPPKKTPTEASDYIATYGGSPRWNERSLQR